MVKRSLRRFPNLVYGPAWQSANVWAPLRWKRAKIHRGSRPRTLGPHQEAGYTSAVVTVAPDPVSLLQSGGVHIRPYMTLHVMWLRVFVATQHGQHVQFYSRKLLSSLDRLGCMSFRSALASICRIRSRVTENCWPTCSSVWSLFMPRPKRMRTMRSSRGISDASRRVVVS